MLEDRVQEIADDLAALADADYQRAQQHFATGNEYEGARRTGTADAFKTAANMLYAALGASHF